VLSLETYARDHAGRLVEAYRAKNSLFARSPVSVLKQQRPRACRLENSRASASLLTKWLTQNPGYTFSETDFSIAPIFVISNALIKWVEWQIIASGSDLAFQLVGLALLIIIRATELSTILNGRDELFETLVLKR
jgi:hypothetical protein